MKDCRKCICNTKRIPCGADTDEKCEKLYASKLSVAFETFIGAVEVILLLWFLVFMVVAMACGVVAMACGIDYWLHWLS